MIQFLSRLVRAEDLTEADAGAAMDLIMNDEATPSQIAGFMVALRVKGESVEEITGLARAMRAHAVPVRVSGDLLDVVGTGGDGLATFNVSTVAAIVAAACGARVAKHGNRAASSRCGSADVLEALGVRIDLGPDGVTRCIGEVGIGFMFAPLYHPSFRFAALPRRELGVRTVFNILGPLSNPAHASFQATGVADPALVGPVAEALSRLGVRRALVFHGAGGMDELSTGGPSSVVEILDGCRSDYQLDPADLGLRPASVEQLRGGDAADNAAIARELLAGDRGPRRDVVLLNAAAALRAAGRAPTWQEGIGAAAEAIDSGRAQQVLERWARVSREASG
jgi:anthranilate phosphoribosyltransferase